MSPAPGSSRAIARSPSTRPTSGTSSRVRCRDGAGDDHDTGHRSEEHTSELQSRPHLVCRLLLEKKKTQTDIVHNSVVYQCVRLNNDVHYLQAVDTVLQAYAAMADTLPLHEHVRESHAPVNERIA